MAHFSLQASLWVDCRWTQEGSLLQRDQHVHRHRIPVGRNSSKALHSSSPHTHLYRPNHVLWQLVSLKIRKCLERAGGAFFWGWTSWTGSVRNSFCGLNFNSTRRSEEKKAEQAEKSDCGCRHSPYCSFFLSKLSYVSSWWWQAAAKTEKTGSKSHDASRIKIITMVILLIRHWFRHRQWWESHCYACCYSWNLKKKLIKNKTHRLLDWLPSQRLLSTVARPCGRFSIVPSTRNWCFYFRSVTPKQMPPYPIWNAKPSMTSWS